LLSLHTKLQLYSIQYWSIVRLPIFIFRNTYPNTDNTIIHNNECRYATRNITYYNMKFCLISTLRSSSRRPPLLRHTLRVDITIFIRHGFVRKLGMRFAFNWSFPVNPHDNIMYDISEVGRQAGGFLQGNLSIHFGIWKMHTSQNLKERVGWITL